MPTATTNTSADLPLQYIKGIGPRRAAALAAEGLVSYEDVVMNVPRAYIHRTQVESLRDVAGTLRGQATPGFARQISLISTVDSQHEGRYGKGNKTYLIVLIHDSDGTLGKLLFWNYSEYYRQLLKPGSVIMVSGVPEVTGRSGVVTFNHPEVITIDADEVEAFRKGRMLPLYSMTQALRNAGFTMKMMRSLAEFVFERIKGTIADPMPVELLGKYGFLNREQALWTLHFPESQGDVARAKQRMSYEELFLFEVRLALRHVTYKSTERGPAMQAASPRARALVESLPFTLTNAQRRAVNAIVADMTSGSAMNRLLQGDVGSGKTIVALLCMLCAVDNGYQTLIMAPTDILAQQHFASLQRLISGLDVSIGLLVGAQRKKVRERLLSEIASGSHNIIVGTHALFEARVRYNNLGLVVVDEQHRFGVAQRSALRAMGIDSLGGEATVPHILVMSATPIPRTLSMTLYGDLDVSVINELPANRRPVTTRVVFESDLPRLYAFVREQISQGRQAFIVYPLVEKSEKLDLKSATEHYEMLATEVFPDLGMGLLHGQMLWFEKEDQMQSFLNREFDILVTTTVVEVGIDVPNASVMIIENAERFGLSQLHQLRGRIGRGEHDSYCFMVTKDYFRHQIRRAGTDMEASTASVRLSTMANISDGFRIAEVDLELRGPGDIMGTRQSGLPDFKFANLVTDVATIEAARKDAFELIEQDPDLKSPQHRALQYVLTDATRIGFYIDVA